MNNILFLSVFALIILTSTSCTKDNNKNNSEPTDTTALRSVNKVFVVNEGQFMQNNSSLSIYDPSTGTVMNNGFATVNQVPLGDVANSASILGDLIYIVVNNSGKIYIADKHSLVHKATITGLDSPREILFISDTKAYVSDLYAKGIHIIDLTTNTVSGFINLDNGNKQFVQHCAESMLAADGLIYASSWSYGDAVLVIDPSSDQLIDSIKVPKQPNSIVLDKDGKLWATSDVGYEGNPFGYEAPALTRINLQTRTVEAVYRLSIKASATQLSINKTKDSLFFLSAGIVKMSIYDKAVPTERIIDGNKLWYSITVSPFADEFYCADAIDYAQNGVVYRYTTGGTVIDSFYAGVNPGAYCFSKE